MLGEERETKSWQGERNRKKRRKNVVTGKGGRNKGKEKKKKKKKNGGKRGEAAGGRNGSKTANRPRTRTRIPERSNVGDEKGRAMEEEEEERKEEAAVRWHATIGASIVHQRTSNVARNQGREIRRESR